MLKSEMINYLLMCGGHYYTDAGKQLVLKLDMYMDYKVDEEILVEAAPELTKAYGELNVFNGISFHAIHNKVADLYKFTRVDLTQELYTTVLSTEDAVIRIAPGIQGAYIVLVDYRGESTSLLLQYSQIRYTGVVDAKLIMTLLDDALVHLQNAAMLNKLRIYSLATTKGFDCSSFKVYLMEDKVEFLNTENGKNTTTTLLDNELPYTGSLDDVTELLDDYSTFAFSAMHDSCVVLFQNMFNTIIRRGNIIKNRNYPNAPLIELTIDNILYRAYTSPVDGVQVVAVISGKDNQLLFLKDGVVYSDPMHIVDLNKFKNPLQKATEIADVINIFNSKFGSASSMAQLRALLEMVCEVSPSFDLDSLLSLVKEKVLWMQSR